MLAPFGKLQHYIRNMFGLFRLYDQKTTGEEIEDTGLR